MNLQNIFDQLTYGELSNSKLGGSDSGGISETDKPKIISHLNMAISALYIKFKLSESLTSVTLVEGVYEYIIDPLVVTGVYNELGVKLGLNDPNDDNSVFTPRWDTLQVPSTIVASTLYVAQYDKPTKLALDADPDITDVDLPDVLLEPLLAYIASRVHTSRNTVESLQEGLAQMNRFNLLCSALMNANILNTSEQATNIKAEVRGWV